MNGTKVYLKSNRTLVYLMISFVALNVVSGVFTLILNEGGGYELNWIARYALAHSPWAFWLIKAGAILIFISFLLLFAKTFPRLVKWIFIVSTIIMLGVCIFNATQLTVV